MHNAILKKGKPSLVLVLPWLFLVIGLGFILGAMLSVWQQPDYSAEVTFATFDIERIAEDEAALLELDSPIDVPTTDQTNYTSYPADGENIGSLSIPALELILPIIQGTGAKELGKGVGHFTQSVLPGEADNCVLSGHRETVFRQLGKLKIGQMLIVQTSAGIFTYEVKGTRIVHADDKTVIVPTEKATLTLITCYPFNTPGYFPDRYIVSADLVEAS